MVPGAAAVAATHTWMRRPAPQSQRGRRITPRTSAIPASPLAMGTPCHASENRAASGRVCRQHFGCTLLAHVALTHTLLLTTPILTTPILADAPSTHPALTHGSHTPHQRAPLLSTPIPRHSPLAICVMTRKGSGDDAGWQAGCESEGLLASLNEVWFR